jgi:hypothetical protein
MCLAAPVACSAIRARLNCRDHDLHLWPVKRGKAAIICFANQIKSHGIDLHHGFLFWGATRVWRERVIFGHKADARMMGTFVHNHFSLHDSKIIFLSECH